MAEPKRKLITDPDVLKQLNAPASKAREWITDPEILKQLNAPEPARQSVPSYDAMGNPTGMTEDAAGPQAMPYGDQMRRVGGVVDDAVRMAANGLTFGMADRFAGAMDAVTGDAPSYSAGVEAQRGRTDAVREANPALAGIAEAAGGLAGGLGLMKNGATLMGRFGPSLAGRAAAMGAEGALYGAAHGAGNTFSDEAADYGRNAGKGAGLGAIVGVGLPVVGSIASTLYQAGKNFGGAPLDGLSRGASGLLRSAAAADEAGIRALNGPDAMLVDAGPSMLGMGQGAATGNGAGKSALATALRERDAGTTGRLAQAADDNLGRAPIPSQVEAGLAANREVVAEGYEPVMRGARAVDTSPLAEALETAAVRLRGPEQRAVRDVRRMLDVEGAPGQLDPDPQTLMATRQAIDGLMEGETNSKVIRQLSIAREQVDGLLARAAPGVKSVDAPMAELYRQSEGLQRGGQIFDTGKTAIRPVELADELRAGALPQGEMIGPSAAPVRVREGARAELDRVVGTSSNDLNALERKLGTADDWNAQKASEVFGETPMQRFMQSIADERNRRNSYQKIVEGSRTAPSTAAAQSMEGGGGVPLDTTVTGAIGRMSGAAFKALAGLSRANTKDEIAQILSQSGDAARVTGELLLLQRQATGETARILNRVFGAQETISASTPALGRR